MGKISLLEKISINRYTPFDKIIGIIATPLDVEGNEFKGNLWNQKIKDYVRLLDCLEKKYNSRILKRYMGSACGRIQVRHAVSKELITTEQYNEILDEMKQ